SREPETHDEEACTAPSRLLGLKELDDGVAFIRAQLASDHTIAARAVIEFVSGVEVPGPRGVEPESLWDLAAAIADVLRVVLAIAEKKHPRPLSNGREKCIDRRHRAVVEIRRRRPDAVQRTHLISQRRLNAVRAMPVHLVAEIG